MNLKGKAMKKLIISTAFLALIGSSIQAWAAIDTEQMFSEDYLRNQGYSPHSIELINLRKIDPYAAHKEEEVQNTPLNWTKKFYNYMDPTADGGNFGKGIISPGIDVPSKL